MTTAPKPKCLQCGSTEGAVQFVNMSFPGAEPFFLNAGPIDKDKPELGDRYEPNPKVGRRHWSGWLHMECEELAAERLERNMKEAEAKTK